MNLAELQAVIPIFIVVATALITLAVEAFRGRDEKLPLGMLGLIGLAGAGAASVMLWGHNRVSLGVVRADNFALFVNGILIVVGILTILFSGDVIEREELPAGEYYALMLFSISGMMLMASATDLLVVFLALEILSLGVYVLTAIRRSSLAGAEGGFKYFLLGAFSSAFFLYGVALTYVVAGSTRFDRVALAIAGHSEAPPLFVLIAVGLVMVGFAFKVSAVPFHMWTPDAYQGAPTIVTGFMSTAVKAAAFAAFVRVFLTAFGSLSEQWIPLLGASAIATMIVGTVVGVAQTSVKRLLAYSSIAHAGYILVGLIAANDTGQAAVLFYLLAYAVTNLGAFGILALLASRSNEHDEVRDFAGLWKSEPVLATLLTVFLLSLGGFPPTAGFIGKWYIFAAAVQQGHYWLAIIGVLTSVISVYYYLRIIVMMYMSESAHTEPVAKLSASATAGLAMATAAVFYLGVYPTDAIELALRSVSRLFWGLSAAMPDPPLPPITIDPTRPRLEPEPTHRPEPRFWPYLDLAEQPSEEELAALDPDLRLALSRTGVGGQGGWGAFSLTLAFPRFDGPDYDRAVALARASRQYFETGSGEDFRVRARFQPDDALALRDLYQLVGNRPGTDVLIDDRPVPYARELWLPLFWCLLPR